ncbi:trypsin-like peptidase domain-containing protein [Sphaerisporangium dianthi]|uniref:Trypsin-like peptidase domain-containing protein n=1 Tax=Sphaerisporangium dianthi TaxID=1436120 RepID=A0ABV9CKK1_9ACTN
MAAPGPRFDAVVELLVSWPGGDRSQASGHRVGDRHVLTARHAVARGARSAESVDVRFGGTGDGRVHPARPVWSSRAPYGDLALLELGQDSRPPAFVPVPLAKVTPAHPARPRCEIIGFPRHARRGHPSGRGGFRERVVVESTVSTAGAKRGLLEIPLDNRQFEDMNGWIGISGAGVFVEGSFVGVVVRMDSSRRMLLAEQLGVATGDIRVSIPGCDEPADSARRLRRLLGGDSFDLPPARRRAGYRDRVEAIAARCPRLSGREREREMLRRFPGPYLLCGGIPWSGKTSLAASFAADPGPGIDVVSFFASRPEGQQEHELWTAVTDQLAAIAHERPPADPKGAFDGLWRRAAEMSRSDDRTLVLLLDGLDELDEDSSGPIGPRLPWFVPDTARVILFSRPNPRIGARVSPDHPLLAGATAVELEPSEHARMARDRAAAELSGLLTAEDGLPRLVLGLLTVAGPLSAPEGSGLLREQGFDVDRGGVQRVFDRAVSGRVLLHADIDDGGRYAFSHEALREGTELGVDHHMLDRHLTAIRTWGDRYQAAGWPDDTPRCLADEYARTLIRAGDRDRLVALLTSPERLALLRLVTGSDLRAMEDLRKGLGLLLGPGAEDLRQAIRAASMVDVIRRGERDVPLDLVIAHAHAGAWARAEHLAHLCERVRGVEAPIAVAEAALAAGRAARCRPMLELARERLAGIDWDVYQRSIDEAENVRFLLTVAGRPDGPAREDPDVRPRGNRAGHVESAGLLARMVALAVRLHRFAIARSLAALMWEHADQVALIDPSCFAALSHAALAATMTAGETDRARALLRRLHESLDDSVPAGRGQAALRRAAEAATLAGMDVARHAFARAIVVHPPDVPMAVDVDEILRRAAASPAEPTSILHVNEHDDFLIEQAYLCVAAEDMEGAARLIEAIASAGPIFSYEDQVAGVALAAAKKAPGSGSRRVLTAADAYVRRTRMTRTSRDWSSDHRPVAAITTAALCHGRERVQSEVGRRTGHLEPEVRGPLLSAVALGAGQAGDVRWALSLLDGLRHFDRSAVLNLARFLAPTVFWPRALALVAQLRASWETSAVVWSAVEPAVRLGDHDTIVELLEAYPGNPLWPGTDDLLCHVVATSARLGSLDLAWEFLSWIEGRSGRLAALTSLIVAASGDRREADLRPRLDEAAHLALHLSEPFSRAIAHGHVAKAALALNDGPAFERALGRARRGCRRVKGKGTRITVFLTLAQVMADAGRRAGADGFLSRAMSEMRSWSDTESRRVSAVQIASLAYAIGRADRARDAAAELLDRERESSGGLSYTLIEAAVSAGDEETARLLAEASTEDFRRPLFAPGEPFVRSRVAEAATFAQAGLWNLAKRVAQIAHPDTQPEILAGLAAASACGNPLLARRWLAQALTEHFSPAALAAACALDSRSGPVALDEVLLRAGAGPPLGATPAAKR